MKTHIEVKHTLLCTDCQEDSEFDNIFETKEEFLEHKRLVHENPDQVLTQEEFDKLTDFEVDYVKSGPETPKREDARKKYDLRFKQKHNIR